MAELTAPEPSLALWPIGNCQVSALVDEAAGFVWGCLPRVDGNPAFCSLMDAERPSQGVWRFTLEGQARAEQRYQRNTPVLVTRLEAKDGSAVEIHDFAPRFERSGRMYRPVAFCRIVRPVAGSPRLTMTLSPTVDWGEGLAAQVRGTNHVRFATTPDAVRLSTDAPLGYLLEGRPFRVEHDLHFFLGPDEPFEGNIRNEVRRMEGQTERYWKRWVRSLVIPFEWQDEVIRCAITLKLCQHEETGAIVAALTTSIPEAAGSGRNWDYRYCWLRDAYYTVQALNRLGALDMLEKYLAYLRNIVDAAEGGHIQPLYSVMGESDLHESVAEHLPGYRGMGPVRRGNAAHAQVQHDCYGQIVLPTVQAFFDTRLFRMADARDFEHLEMIGEAAFARHDRPDAGLWEFRTREEVHTYSTVMCWAACDRLANVAAHIGKPERERFWRGRARHIRKFIERGAWIEAGSAGYYSASLDSDYLDASLLQMVELRFLAPQDERFQQTFAAVERELRRGDYMLRYSKHDDFGEPSTAFNVCTFWLIEALHLSGRGDEARSLFLAMLERASSSRLLSEDMDCKTGELWGNFPQTYSLVGVINCACLVSRPWSEVR
jgi:GH15 family glucan-1,4-alpha-glucosidase